MLRSRLDQLMVERKLAITRSQSANLIRLGKVKVGGRVMQKPGAMVDERAIISLGKGPVYVSRAAYKLASVLEKLAIDFRTKIVLDVGASKGGFTELALHLGAQKIYAVDVGTAQLDPRLRSDPRVVVMEKADIRDVKKLPEPIDLAMVDVSFISIRLVLPAVINLLRPSGRILAMVKPQFEAGDAKLLNRGVVKNETMRRQILKDFETWAKAHFRIQGKADSKVAGTKGNLERFYLLEPTPKR